MLGSERAYVGTEEGGRVREIGGWYRRDGQTDGGLKVERGRREGGS